MVPCWEVPGFLGGGAGEAKGRSGGREEVGETPPVPAGLTSVASKDTGGLSPAYKGLGPEIEAQDSLGLRTNTLQIW